MAVSNAKLPLSGSSSWCSLFHSLTTQEDVAVWPHSVTILLEFTSFLAALHWPQGADDSGK